MRELGSVCVFNWKNTVNSTLESFFGRGINSLCSVDHKLSDNHKTRDEIAQIAGTSGATVQRTKYILEHRRKGYTFFEYTLLQKICRIGHDDIITSQGCYTIFFLIEDRKNREK